MRPTANESVFDTEARTQKIVMWAVLQLASVLSLATKVLPAKKRPEYLNFIQFLKRMAAYVALPRYVRAWGHPTVALRAMVDTLIPALVLGGWFFYWDGLMPCLMVLAMTIVIYFILIDFVMSCLMVSADLYEGSQAAFYRSLSIRSSAYTMRAVVVLILLLLVLFTFIVPVEKTSVLFLLCIVLLLTRLLYLLRMVYASSQEITLRDEDITVQEIEEHAELSEGMPEEDLDAEYPEEAYMDDEEYPDEEYQ